MRRRGSIKVWGDSRLLGSPRRSYGGQRNLRSKSTGNTPSEQNSSFEHLYKFAQTPSPSMSSGLKHGLSPLLGYPLHSMGHGSFGPAVPTEDGKNSAGFASDGSLGPLVGSMPVGRSSLGHEVPQAAGQQSLEVSCQGKRQPPSSGKSSLGGIMPEFVLSRRQGVEGVQSRGISGSLKRQRSGSSGGSGGRAKRLKRKRELLRVWRDEDFGEGFLRSRARRSKNSVMQGTQTRSQSRSCSLSGRTKSYSISTKTGTTPSSETSPRQPANTRTEPKASRSLRKQKLKENVRIGLGQVSVLRRWEPGTRQLAARWFSWLLKLLRRSTRPSRSLQAMLFTGASAVLPNVYHSLEQGRRGWALWPAVSHEELLGTIDTLLGALEKSSACFTILQWEILQERTAECRKLREKPPFGQFPVVGSKSPKISPHSGARTLPTATPPNEHYGESTLQPKQEERQGSRFFQEHGNQSSVAANRDSGDQGVRINPRDQTYTNGQASGEGIGQSNHPSHSMRRSSNRIVAQAAKTVQSLAEALDSSEQPSRKSEREAISFPQHSGNGTEPANRPVVPGRAPWLALQDWVQSEEALTFRLVRKHGVPALVGTALLEKKVDVQKAIASPTVVSLVCPLSQQRMRVPARTKTCAHLHCFDLATHLQVNVERAAAVFQKTLSGPLWRCPICSEPATWPQLLVDGAIERAIMSFPVHVLSVRVFSSGHQEATLQRTPSTPELTSSIPPNQPPERRKTDHGVTSATDGTLARPLDPRPGNSWTPEPSHNMAPPNNNRTRNPRPTPDPLQRQGVGAGMDYYSQKVDEPSFRFMPQESDVARGFSFPQTGWFNKVEKEGNTSTRPRSSKSESKEKGEPSLEFKPFCPPSRFQSPPKMRGGDEEKPKGGSLPGVFGRMEAVLAAQRAAAALSAMHKSSTRPPPYEPTEEEPIAPQDRSATWPKTRPPRQNNVPSLAHLLFPTHAEVAQNKVQVPLEVPGEPLVLPARRISATLSPERVHEWYAAKAREFAPYDVVAQALRGEDGSGSRKGVVQGLSQLEAARTLVAGVTPIVGEVDGSGVPLPKVFDKGQVPKQRGKQMVRK